MKKVSIIIPIYHGQRYISRILKMVDENARLVKDSAEVELILVNDSPDVSLNTDFTQLQYAEAVCIDNERIAVYINRESMGLENRQGSISLCLIRMIY